VKGYKMKLKGIFKLGNYFDRWSFQAWMERVNPNVILCGGDRVAVTFKQGKKKRLKKMTVEINYEYPPCSCCPPERKISLV